MFVNWDSVKDVAEKLPRKLTDCHVKFMYPNKNIAGKDLLKGANAIKVLGYKVDAQKVRVALLYLINNNYLYREINIDAETMKQLEEDCSKKDVTLDEIFKDIDDASNRYNLCMPEHPVDVEDVAEVLSNEYGKKNNTIYIHRKGNVCYADQVPNLLGQAFLCLFPDGQGGDYRNFPVKLTTAEYLEHSMEFGDPRFSQHYRYLFMMVNLKNLEAAYKSISATMKGKLTNDELNAAGIMTDDVFEEMSKPVSNEIKNDIVMLLGF
jgi:hypothetical protein